MSDIICTSCFHIHAKACDVCSNLSSGKLYNGRNFWSISSHCQCCTTACAPWCSNGSTSTSNEWVLSNGLCTSGSGYKEHLPELLWNRLHVLIIMHAKACDVAYNLSSGKWRIFLTIVELSLAPLSCCTSTSAPSQNFAWCNKWILSNCLCTLSGVSCRILIVCYSFYLLS